MNDIVAEKFVLMFCFFDKKFALIKKISTFANV